MKSIYKRVLEKKGTEREDMYLFATDLMAELSKYNDLNAMYEEHKVQPKRDSLFIPNAAQKQERPLSAMAPGEISPSGTRVFLKRGEGRTLSNGRSGSRGGSTGRRASVSPRRWN